MFELKLFVLFVLVLESFAVVPLDSSVSLKATEYPVVKISEGLLKGKVEDAREGRPFFSFRGIPYAKPPVGKLRFRAPLPPKPWIIIKDAKVDAPCCLQIDYFYKKSHEVEGSEDCLYLNVYTPYVPSILKLEKERRLPVMVYIHGGGYLSGAAEGGFLGPEYFMEKDVVLVTFNYRVGVFGFLSTSDDAAPGNWGMKDQIAALKWVQRNIEYFGGDKDKVTIFGNGAGAASVHYHMLHPEAPRLFHRAISQSGSAFSLWARPQNKLLAKVTRLQAEFVGCDPDASTYSIVECLRGVDAHVLAASRNKFRYFDVEPLFLYLIAVEKLTKDNPYPYLTADPRYLILEGKFHRVPWIIGLNQNEGTVRASALLRQKKVRQELRENFDVYAPNMFFVPASAHKRRVQDLWYRIKSKFLESDTVDVEDPDWVQRFIDLYGDRYFARGIYESALVHASRGHHPIFVYNFNYQGRYSYGDLFALTKDDIDFRWGVGHGDNLIYLFQSPKLFPHMIWSNEDLQVSKALIEMMVNFADYGNPTPYKYDRWHPLPDLSNKKYIANFDFVYLNFTNSYKKSQPVTLQHERGFYPERMWKWDSLHLPESFSFIRT